MAGLVIDTSVLVAAERARMAVDQLRQQLAIRFEASRLLVSAASVMELVHGAGRAETDHRRLERERFIMAVQTEFEILPMTTETAWRAGRISAALSRQGQSVGTVDLIIASSALELGAAVLTHNVKHFSAVPELMVVSYSASQG